MSPQKRLITTLAIAIVALVAVGGYLYWQLQLTKDPAKVAEREVKALVMEVSKLIVLPEDETPTIATVTDVEALKDQPFFAKASVGDKVLIFTNAKKAILYNPTAKKIIEVAPINIGESAPARTSTTTTSTTTTETEE